MEHLIDYGKGIVFIIFMITLFNLLGRSLTKHNHSFSKNLLIGYVTYLFLQFVLGFITQLFRLNFYIYMMLMIQLVACLLYFIYQRQKNIFHIDSILSRLSDHLRKYKIAYILAGILLAMNLLNLTYMWLGNHQDDGLYLLKVALAPSLGGNYDMNYATGFQEPLALSRMVNTFELDYAFWSKLVGIYPSIFCKAVMSYLNYFLVLNGFNLILQTFRKEEKDTCSYYLCATLFFAINPETLVNHNILAQQDAWHFNTAIWYGSGIVRCLGPVLLLFPFIENRTLTVRKIFWFIITSVALISRASQALPLIYLSALAIAILCSISNLKKWKICSILFLLACGILLILVPFASTDLINTAIISVSQLLHTPVFVFSLVLILSVPFILRNKAMISCSGLLFIMFLLATIPLFQSLFLHLSTVTFVIGRTLTMFSFYSFIFAMIYIGFIFEKYIKHTVIIKSFYALFSCACIGIYMVSLMMNFGLHRTLSNLYHNAGLIPNSTELLSRRLEHMSEQLQGEDLYVIGPSWVNIDGFNHVLGTTLRIEAPNIYSIAAIHRYANMVETAFSGFSDVDQNQFESFRENPNDANMQINMKQLLSKYPINVIFDVSEETSKVLESEFAYHLIDVVRGEKTYYILVSNEVYLKYF